MTLCSSSSQRCWGGVQVTARVKFFNTKLRKPSLYEPGFVHGGLPMLKQGNGQTETVDTKFWEHYWLKYHAVDALAFRFLFRGPKRPKLIQEEKQTQTKTTPKYVDRGTQISLTTGTSMILYRDGTNQIQYLYWCKTSSLVIRLMTPFRPTMVGGFH